MIYRDLAVIVWLIHRQVLLIPRYCLQDGTLDGRRDRYGAIGWPGWYFVIVTTNGVDLRHIKKGVVYALRS